MAENPVIVFFSQSKTTQLLPIAFPLVGESFNPCEKKSEASLIVLNDDASVATLLVHSNRDRQAPLGVIWHNETNEKKESLEGYEQLIRLAGFSHVPGNQIFDSVKTILESNGDVKGFVEDWRRVIVQSELDELAALITYMALLREGERSEEGAYARYEAILGRYASHQDCIRNHICNKAFLEAVHEVERIAGQEA